MHSATKLIALQMLPCIPFDGISDRGYPDSIFSGKICVRHYAWDISPLCILDLIGCHCLLNSSFVHSIMGVLNWFPGKQVRRVTAWRVVTRMTGMYIVSKFDTGQYKGQSIGSHVPMAALCSDMDTTVPAFIPTTHPRPTCIGAARLINFVPKPITSHTYRTGSPLIHEYLPAIIAALCSLMWIVNPKAKCSKGEGAFANDTNLGRIVMHLRGLLSGYLGAMTRSVTALLGHFAFLNYTKYLTFMWYSRGAP